MNAKKLFTTTILFALTVLLALSGVWQSAAAKSIGTFRLEMGETIDVGKQGLHVTNIPTGVSHVFLDTVKGESLPPRFNHDVNIDYRAPVLEVRFLTEQGGEVRNISAQVYVYFNIGKVERALWEAGGMDNIAIWFANETTGQWEMCFTYFVDESLDNGKYDRLSCLAPGSGYYVLGQVNFDREAYYKYTPYTPSTSQATAEDTTTTLIRNHIAE
ncbi:MAG: hypothetical protein Fur0022_22030 [Anaerolineales bacterium]